MAKHDESKCLNSIRRVCSVNPSNKLITAQKSTVIGIKRWGMIDYLCHYCGYVFMWGNSAVTIDKTSYERKDKKKELKEVKRQSKNSGVRKFNDKRSNKQ